MRQKLAILAAITLLLISAKSVRTVRLTVVNKSGLPVEVRLTGTYYEEIYYLRVPEGDRDHASEAHIDVLPDDYSMQVFYKEYWDPVYGYDCSEGGKNIKLTHSARLTFLGCNYPTPNNGEPSSLLLKYPEGKGRCRMPMRMPEGALPICK